MRKRLIALVFSLVSSASFAATNGILINTLPTPVSGVYELGNTSFKADAGSVNDNGLVNIGYIDWAALKTAGLPANAKVRLVGGAALYQVPSDVSLDFSVATCVVFLDRSVFARTAVYTNRVGGISIYLPVTKITKASEESGANVTFTKDGNAHQTNAPISNDGTWTIGTQCGLTLDEGLTGAATGRFRLAGFGMWLKIPGTLNYAGEIYFGVSQVNQSVTITSPEDESYLGILTSNEYGGSDGAINKGYTTGQQLIYNPVRATDDEPGTLVIEKLNPSYQGGLIGLVKDGLSRRWGCQLCTFSNNTIKVKSVTNAGSIGLVANRSATYRNNAIPAFDLGFANFEIGGTNAYDVTPTYYPTPNCNIKFTGISIYDATKILTVDYSGESNVVNRGTLDFTEFGKAPKQDHYSNSISIKGASPSNLPRTIQVREEIEQATVVHVSGNAWVMPFDFGAASDEINPARCETNCRLEVPTVGTVAISNVTTAASVQYPGQWTVYPILTCKEGGETAFANWTISVVGNWPENIVVEPVVKSIGLFVRIRRRSSALVTFD